MIDCYSGYNAVKPAAVYGAGFMIPGGVTGINLISEENYVGYYIENKLDDKVDIVSRAYNCIDYSSNDGWSIKNGLTSTASGSLYFIDCGSVNADRYAIYAEGLKNSSFDNFLIQNPTGSSATGVLAGALIGASTTTYATNSTLDFNVQMSGGSTSMYPIYISRARDCIISGDAELKSSRLLRIDHASRITIANWNVLTDTGNTFLIDGTGIAYVKDTVVKFTNGTSAGYAFLGRDDYAAYYVIDKNTVSVLNMNVNLGYRCYFVQSWSIATINAGGTSVTVTHGIYTTPTLVTITAQDTFGADAFISDVGATTFKINIPAGVGTNAVFFWYAAGPGYNT